MDLRKNFPKRVKKKESYHVDEQGLCMNVSSYVVGTYLPNKKSIYGSRKKSALGGVCLFMLYASCLHDL